MAFPFKEKKRSQNIALKTFTLFGDKRANRLLHINNLLVKKQI